MTVISLTNCPIEEVPAPPAVTVIIPALVTVPAKSPAVPAAKEVWSDRFPTAPTLGAAVGTASAWV